MPFIKYMLENIGNTSINPALRSLGSSPAGTQMSDRGGSKDIWPKLLPCTGKSPALVGMSKPSPGTRDSEIVKSARLLDVSSPFTATSQPSEPARVKLS